MSKAVGHLQEKEAGANHNAQGEMSNMIQQMITLRRRKGLSQQQLAELVGTHQPSISRLEAGHIGSITFLLKIADALDASIEIRFVPHQAGPVRHPHSKSK